jgi:adhesin transport system outer membrane protein
VYGRGSFNSLVAVSALALMAACSGGFGDVTRGATSISGTDDGAATPALDSQQITGEQSQIIEGLLNRRSVLEDGAFANVAKAVLAANSRAAEAELRAATLRAEARANNWLPTLGPSLSLSSLGDVVTSLVIEQVLFDNGRKKAERDYAAADVEVAAVALAVDTNDRVLAALELYIDSEQAKARARVNNAAMERMSHFEYVMTERVRGGVSGRVDLQIVQQKMNQMRSDMSSDQEAAASALSELGAMSANSLDGISGLSSVNGGNPNAQPLTVMKAEAESERAVAEAIVARAGFLPGLTAAGSVGSVGSAGGLNVTTDNGFGFGTGASLRALEEQQAAAAARVGQVQEDANRSLRALEGKLSSLQRQESQAQSLASQAAENYEIFAEQQRSGHRAVPEVVGIFETKVRTEREAVSLRYEIARVKLRIAAQMGTLVNGEQI